MNIEDKLRKVANRKINKARVVSRLLDRIDDYDDYDDYVLLSDKYSVSALTFADVARMMKIIERPTCTASA